MAQFRNWKEFLDSSRLGSVDPSRAVTNIKFFLYNYLAVAVAALVVLNAVVHLGGLLSLIVAVGLVAAHAAMHQPSIENQAFSASGRLRDRVDSKLGKVATAIDKALGK